MFNIVTDFEGANLQVLGIDGDTINVEVEQRDTVENWFFWCFKVEGAEGKTLTFKFNYDFRVGYLGPAVSYDLKSWHWQYEDGNHSGEQFTYTFAEDEKEVYFAHDFVYRPELFFDFCKNNNLRVKEFCVSEKERSVPYLEFGKGNETILLSARHHACESTGNFVLEGVIEEGLKTLADKFKFIVIPFVDYDGVIAGDQGKARNNHDHNRDYVENEAPRYSVTAKIRSLVESENVRFAFDFHSPWHLGGGNDAVFIPYKFDDAPTLMRLKRFSLAFEEQNSDDALPHFTKDDIQPNKGWNNVGTPCFGTFWGNHGAELSFTLETAYYLAGGVPFSAKKAKQTGKNFIKALVKYLEKQ